MIEESNLPEVVARELVPSRLPEVVDEGGRKVLRPDILQMVTQLASLAQLARVRKAVESIEDQMERAPVGRMRPYERTISGSEIERWEVKSERWVGRPCTSATIYNDGPDSAWVCLNDIRDGFQEVKEGESIDFDFHGNALIERFFFYSTFDGTANLRIPLEY